MFYPTSIILGMRAHIDTHADTHMNIQHVCMQDYTHNMRIKEQTYRHIVRHIQRHMHKNTHTYGMYTQTHNAHTYRHTSTQTHRPAHRHVHTDT